MYAYKDSNQAINPNIFKLNIFTIKFVESKPIYFFIKSLYEFSIVRSTLIIKLFNCEIYFILNPE